MKLPLEQRPIHEYVRKHAKKTPTKTAINFYGTLISYKELDLYSDRFAQYLINSGIEKGDRVALFMQNCPQYIICHLGIQKIGALVGPCNPMFKEWELECQLNDMQAKTMVTMDHLYPIFKRIKDNIKVENVVVSNYGDFLSEDPAFKFPEKIYRKVNITKTVDLKEIILNNGKSVV